MNYEDLNNYLKAHGIPLHVISSFGGQTLAYKIHLAAVLKLSLPCQTVDYKHLQRYLHLWK